MRLNPVIGVLAGCGGAGASVLAAVLAGLLAERDGHAFLIDCDPFGGGIDVLLGCERQPGPRWGQVRLRGGPLDPVTLRQSLPRWQRVSFLAADSAQPLDPDAVDQLIGAAASMSPVLLDLPRQLSAAGRVALDRCQQVVLVTAAEVRAVTASALVAARLDRDRGHLVVRGSSRSLPPEQIGELLGLPVLGMLPTDPASCRPGGLDLSRLRRRTRLLALEILDRLVVTANEPVPPAGIEAVGAVLDGNAGVEASKVEAA
jgi:secretion/DNA translocation related CpaE-like protein